MSVMIVVGNLGEVHVVYQTVSEFLVDFARQLHRGLLRIETGLEMHESEKLELLFEVPGVTRTYAVDAVVVATFGSRGGGLVSFSSGLATLDQLAEESVRLEETLRTAHRKQRKAPRIQDFMEVRYRANENLVSDYSTNLSKEGIFVRSNNPLAVGREVELELHLPCGKILKARGRVVHSCAEKIGSKEPGMGIQFVQFEGGSCADLALYIDAVLRLRGAVVFG